MSWSTSVRRIRHWYLFELRSNLNIFIDLSRVQYSKKPFTRSHIPNKQSREALFEAKLKLALRVWIKVGDCRISSFTRQVTRLASNPLFNPTGFEKNVN